MLCACGSKKEYLQCCGIYITGQLIPQMPEQLMRSRYVAYTQANIEYIVATMGARALIDFDIKEALIWAKSVKWLKLEVIRVDTLSENRGLVEFKAYYRYNNKKHCLHEISEFKHEDNHWYYVGEL